ncbi:MAG: tRNA (guanosine(37)-N1)-methyltransferase TrmD [Rickettsiaceae bacterium]|nr:tRNA (guanosine(37)-N1)-methyltransferase TrmD [Rickettsiaceae bacterium]
MRVKILTTIPEVFPGLLGVSLIGKAREKGIWSLEIIDIKDFALNKHRKIDDEPFGGGNGMLMLPEILARALDYAKKDMISPEIFYLSPRGKRLTQSFSKEISAIEEIIFICARFEGVDERVIEEYNARLISIGDYVLSGGEIAAMVVLESSLRLVPGVLANESTLSEESFNYVKNYGNLLEYPQYTRPADWRGRKVPEILLSGNHKLIEKWRLEKSLEITERLRPDLLEKN